MLPDSISSPSERDHHQDERLRSCEIVMVSRNASALTTANTRHNWHNKKRMSQQNNYRIVNGSGSANHLCAKTIIRCTKGATRYHHYKNHRLTFKRLLPLLSMTLCFVVVAVLSVNNAQRTQAEAAELSTGGGGGGGMASRVASKLQSGGVRLARKFELATSSGQINKWLVHQVAPAMANKLVNNVLQAPKSTSSASSGDSSSSSNKKSAIDTQALADKIVDKLADSIKKRKKQADISASSISTGATNKNQIDSNSNEANESVVGEGSIKTDPAKSKSSSNRRGKSLVSDTVHQAVQNLFSKDQRILFGRTIEKSKLPLRHNAGNLLHHNSSNNWLMVKEPVYDQNLFVSTDSSKLDENPVVLRAEHGHNLTTTDSSIVQHNGGQNISPLISSLMSNTATNQIGNKLLQKHRLQQKYVHTNRHNQQQLAPKPWPAPNSHNRRHQQQSPYSLPVTSDMNIVQAPSSPAPPPVSSTSTTSTTTTTTTNSPTSVPAVFSYPPQDLVIQLGSNKFKINNRHQFPSSSVPLSSSSWYSSNRNHQQNNNHRYQHHHPSTTSTSTTTTTTTTTTTPEPPTYPPMTEPMDSLDIDQQTSAPSSQILSSVAQSALEALAQSASQNSDESTIYNPFSNSSYGTQISPTASPSTRGHSSSGESLKSIKGASPSTTTARQSVISAEAIPTALGAPLYHLTRANFTVTSIMAPPPRRNGASPAARLAAQYFQKGLNNLSSNIFGRQSKGWARRLGLSSVLLSGLLYGAAILANPGAPLPTNGFEG